MKDCEHKEWIGSPPGCVPLEWKCVDCGTRMTAGEMVLWSEIQQLKAVAKKADWMVSA